MARPKEEESTDISKVTVRLSPILGIQPGTYLTVIYSLFLALLVFLFLFLPGIHRNGSLMSIQSTPPSAAVYVDDRYVGATPVRTFVRSGNHVLRVEKPYFAPDSHPITVGGKLFGSLFVPRRVSDVESLKLDDPTSLLAAAFTEFSQWALVDTVLPNYQLPPTLKNTVADIVESGDPDSRTAAAEMLASAARNVHNSSQLADLVGAEAALIGDTRAATPIDIVAVASGFLSALHGWPNGVFWLADSLDRAAQDRLGSTAWYKKYAMAYEDSIAGFQETRGTPGFSTVVLGIPFIPVPSGSFVMGLAAGSPPQDPLSYGPNLPHVVRVGAFSMSATDVTYAQYGAFLAEIPKWLPSERNELVASGLVTADYLKDWETMRGTQRPVVYVSSFAADAYCEWLTAKLGIPGLAVRLPSEAELEFVARMNVDPKRSVFHETAVSSLPAGSGAPNALGITDLLGNVWEWTRDSYFPSDYLFSSWDGTPVIEPPPYAPGAEVAVRGGSFASSRDAVSYLTRGSQAASWCTPYLGYRLVLVRD